MAWVMPSINLNSFQWMYSFSLITMKVRPIITLKKRRGRVISKYKNSTKDHIIKLIVLCLELNIYTIFTSCILLLQIPIYNVYMSGPWRLIQTTWIYKKTNQQYDLFVKYHMKVISTALFFTNVTTTIASIITKDIMEYISFRSIEEHTIFRRCKRSIGLTSTEGVVGHLCHQSILNPPPITIGYISIDIASSQVVV